MELASFSLQASIFAEPLVLPSHGSLRLEWEPWLWTGLTGVNFLGMKN